MVRKKKSQTEEKSPVKAYEPNERERAAIALFAKERDSRPLAPRVKVSQKEKGGKVEIAFDHPDQAMGNLLLMQAVGSTSPSFCDAILHNVINIASNAGQVDERAVNSTLAVIAGIKPKDELEAMLVTQMAAVHLATITQVRRFANAETIAQFDCNERALNKLARTFTTQMEALKRYRTGGEQKVTVHHVTVNEGGQAIVGTVEQPKSQGEG
jgi:hypothetical protein